MNQDHLRAKIAAKTIFIFALGFLITSNCSASELDALVLEGREIHSSLQTPKLDSIRNVPDGIELPSNPQLSTDKKFIEAVSRSSSHGRLDGKGIRSALYARYTVNGGDLGFYGLEAKSEKEVEWREAELRSIWAHNESLNRARVYRKGLVLVVVWAWYSGDQPAYWDTANKVVAKRLELDHKKGVGTLKLFNNTNYHKERTKRTPP